MHPTFFLTEPPFPRETVPVRAKSLAHHSGTEVLQSRDEIYSDSPQDQTEGHLQEHIVSESTPFFHVDLVAAVRAAEKLGLKAEERENGSGENRQSRCSQGDILIDLQN